MRVKFVTFLQSLFSIRTVQQNSIIGSTKSRHNSDCNPTQRVPGRLGLFHTPTLLGYLIRLKMCQFGIMYLR